MPTKLAPKGVQTNSFFISLTTPIKATTTKTKAATLSSSTTTATSRKRIAPISVHDRVFVSSPFSHCLRLLSHADDGDCAEIEIACEIDDGRRRMYGGACLTLSVSYAVSISLKSFSLCFVWGTNHNGNNSKSDVDASAQVVDDFSHREKLFDERYVMTFRRLRRETWFVNVVSFA